MITLDDVKKMEIELEYLRYFYDAVDDPLGCASDDVRYYQTTIYG